MQEFDSSLIDTIRSASHIAVLTGAGVSSESGIPTFRDALTGYWEKYNPADLATPQAFAANPQMVTRWYDERRCAIAACKPNPGHIALAQLQAHVERQNRRFTLITQNVDRLHQVAGSTNVLELHGTLWVWRCVDCLDESEERGPAFAEYPPRCTCDGAKRPGVVWFGESLPARILLQAERSVADCDLFLSLGTSSVVYPAAGLIDLARQHGAKVLEINPQQTDASHKATWSLRGKTGELLPKLMSHITDKTSAE